MGQHGFISTWIKDLSIGDQDTLQKYMPLIQKVGLRRNKSSSHSFNRGLHHGSQNQASSTSDRNWSTSTSTSERRGKPHFDLMLSPVNQPNKSSTSDSSRSVPQYKTKSSSKNPQSLTSDSRGSPQSKTKSILKKKRSISPESSKDSAMQIGCGPP